MGLKKNNPGCGCCEDLCAACENVNGLGDDFNTGLQFTISGFANKDTSICDCTNFDGTYRVERITGTLDDGRISPTLEDCNGEQVYAGTCCSGSGVYQWLLLRWHVWEYTGSSLGLRMFVYLLEHATTCPAAEADSTERMWLPYEKLAITQSCASMSSVSLTYSSGMGGYSDAEGCSNYDGLTVTCDSY